MPWRGLEVLAQRHEITADRAKVGQRLEDLLRGLAQAEHQAALGEGLRAGCLHVPQDIQADVVLALAADLLLKPGDRLEVVVEDLRTGGEDKVDDSRRGRRNRE